MYDACVLQVWCVRIARLLQEEDDYLLENSSTWRQMRSPAPMILQKWQMWCLLASSIIVLVVIAARHHKEQLRPQAVRSPEGHYSQELLREMSMSTLTRALFGACIGCVRDLTVLPGKGGVAQKKATHHGGQRRPEPVGQREGNPETLSRSEVLKDCVDTPGWLNQSPGKETAVFKGDILSCTKYEELGYCRSGVISSKQKMGAEYNFPEAHCCACASNHSARSTDNNSCTNQCNIQCNKRCNRRCKRRCTGRCSGQCNGHCKGQCIAHCSEKECRDLASAEPAVPEATFRTNLNVADLQRAAPLATQVTGSGVQGKGSRLSSPCAAINLTFENSLQTNQLSANPLFDICTSRQVQALVKTWVQHRPNTVPHLSSTVWH